MKAADRKQHWETVYRTKADKELSWYQPEPEASLSFFSTYAIPKNAKIIDVGGGNSRLFAYLLQAGYRDVTVLDISETALRKARARAGKLAGKVKWIVADITTFQPESVYDVWHDRAVFHFLTSLQEKAAYIQLLEAALVPGGHLMMATFSEKGPQKCSGLPVARYGPEALADCFSEQFHKIACMDVLHRTPFDKVQDFTYCYFKKKADPAGVGQ